MARVRRDSLTTGAWIDRIHLAVAVLAGVWHGAVIGGHTLASNAASASLAASIVLDWACGLPLVHNADAIAGEAVLAVLIPSTACSDSQ